MGVGGGVVTTGGNSAAGVGGALTSAVTGGAATTIATGGTSASSTSTTPTPTQGLYVAVTKLSGSGTNTFNPVFVIHNMSSAAADMSGVKLRYFYQDDSWAAKSVVIEKNSLSIGWSGAATVSGIVGVPATSAAGADHYIELSFTGILYATGSPPSTAPGSDPQDTFTIDVRAHASDNQGSVDLTNDYSYGSGALGTSKLVTLYAGGNLIWGEEPGGSAAGTGGASGLGGTSATGGISGVAGSETTGGTSTAITSIATGGVAGGSGGASNGGASSVGGGDATGGSSSVSSSDVTGGTSSVSNSDVTGGTSSVSSSDVTGGTSSVSSSEITGGAFGTGGDVSAGGSTS